MLNKALTHFKNGEYSSSKIILEKILQIKHRNVEALHLLGIIFAIEKNFTVAIDYFSKALKLNPLDQKVLFNRANAYYEFGKPELSISDTEKLILLNNKNVDALLINSNAKMAYGDIDGAIVSLDRVLNINPNNYKALVNKGTLLIEQEKYNVAIETLDYSIKINPELPEAYNQIGRAMKGLSKNNKAITFFKRAIEINPEYKEAHNNLGNTLHELERFDEALTSYEKSISIDPYYPETYYNIGNTLHVLERFAEALASYKKSITINPNYPEAFYNIGNLLQKLRRFEDAVNNYDSAISLKSNYAEAYHNRGNSLRSLRRIVDSISSYEHAIALNPNGTNAYISLANSLKEIGRIEEAISNINMAITLDSNVVEGYLHLGILYVEQKQFDEAVVNFSKVLLLKSDYDYFFGDYMHAKMQICDWSKFNENLDQLLNNIDLGKKTSASFPVLALTDLPTAHLKSAETWINDNYPLNTTLGVIRIPQGKKIRIGYFSADFREHAVSYLIAELFELHQRNLFDVIGFSFGARTNDLMEQRIIRSLDKFIDVRFKSDIEIAKLSRDLFIDIAIDLNGHTQHSRCGIFSYRAAPVQVSYLGYLGSMGADYYDYLIADSSLIPVESRQYYKEKVVYLPSYQVNDSKRIMSDVVFTKVDLNIDEESFVFCCFNTSYKITPTTFYGWINILESVPSSVLLLYCSNKWAEINLQKEFVKRGINKDRLFFCGLINRSDYLARFKVADLFLDTFPYNAGTTASDALWAGLPVLTRMGKSFASRMAASLLNAVDLPELITTSQEQYEARAIELATNREKLMTIKEKLASKRLTSVLFDSSRFSKHIEIAYMNMYERYKANLPPDHIYIEP